MFYFFNLFSPPIIYLTLIFNFPLKYEDLEDEMFDEVFRFIIECKQHVDIIRLE